MNKIIKSLTGFVLAASIIGSTSLANVSANVNSKDTYCLFSCKYTSNWTTLQQNSKKIVFNSKNTGFVLTHSNNTYSIEKINPATGVSQTVVSINQNSNTAAAAQYATMETFQMSGDTIYTLGISNSDLLLYKYNTLTDSTSVLKKTIAQIAGYRVVSDRGFRLDQNGGFYALLKNNSDQYKIIKFNSNLGISFSRQLKVDSDKAWDVDKEGNIYFANANKYVKVLSVNNGYSSAGTKTYKLMPDSKQKAIDLYASDTNNPSDIFVVYEYREIQTLKLINQTENKIPTINLQANVYKLYPTSIDNRLVILARNSNDTTKTINLYRTAADHKVTKLFSYNNAVTLPTAVMRDFKGDVHILTGKTVSKLDFNPTNPNFSAED